MDRRDVLLFGWNRAVSGQLVALAIGLGALLAAIFYTDVNTLWPVPLASSGAVLLVGLAAVEASHIEGLQVAGLLAFAAALPAFVFHPPSGPTFAVTLPTAPLAVLKAAAVAVGPATVGFGFGAGLRRRRDARRDASYTPSAETLPALALGPDRRLAARWLSAGAGGLVVSALLAFAPLFGVFLALQLRGGFSPPGPPLAVIPAS